MAAEIPSTDDDAPALAGAIVYHAGEVCESVDHLWRVLGEVSIPVDGLTDDRQQHKAANGTEPMARVYLYQKIYDLAQSEVADRLENQPSLLKTLDLDKAPSQQSISYAWKQFSEQTKRTLNAAATGIAQEAVDRGIILEARVPLVILVVEVIEMVVLFQSATVAESPRPPPGFPSSGWRYSTCSNRGPRSIS